jgi:hypothetical protein
MCAFIIASEMNYVDDDDWMLQDYKILEFVLFSLVSSDSNTISGQFFV